MSLLLEALRKADRHRRDRLATDGPEPVSATRPRAAAPWGLLVALLLLLNALALAAFLLWRTPGAGDRAPAPAATAARTAPPPALPVRPLAVETEPDPARSAARPGPGEAAGVPAREAPAALRRELQLNVHAWAPEPDARFVLINLRRYGEGDPLPGGGRVVEITREGVVVERRGERLLLPRQ